MNVNRILMVAEFLEKLQVPDHKFNLDQWTGGYFEYSNDLVIMEYIEDNDIGIVDNYEYLKVDYDGTPAKIQACGYSCSRPVDCKTVACAMGWVAFEPKFNELGLFIYNETIMYIDDDIYKNFSAIFKFFEINSRIEEDVLYDIFLDSKVYRFIDGRIRPHHVAAKLRELVKIGITKFDNKYKHSFDL